MALRLPRSNEDLTREVSSGSGFRLPAGVQVAGPGAGSSSPELHKMLDTPVADLVKKYAPDKAAYVPEGMGKATLRETLKTSNFMVRNMITSGMEPHLAKMGLTSDQLVKALDEKPPPQAAPAAPAAAPAAPPPVAAPAAPAAPAAAPAPPAAKQYELPPEPPANRGPTMTAAAAQPSGGPLDYLAKYGGHASVVRDGKIVPVHPGEAGTYKATDPEFAARLTAAGQAYEKETGKAPKYGEMSRGEDVQSVYYDRYKSGQGGLAAAPGRSQHQHGGAADLPASGFRDWLYAGNKDRFGLHFPVKGDTPHVQSNPAFKTNFATAQGPGPGVDKSVTEGAGPAAVAAARAAPSTAAVAAPGAGDPRGMGGYIRETAAKYGINPEIAMKVAKSEGLAQFSGDNGKSGGAFQLYTGGGLGNEFQKSTGLDPLDPKNEKATIDYALKHASQNGWGSWYGAGKAGIGDREGIGGDYKTVSTDLPKTEYLDPTPNVGAGESDYAKPADSGGAAVADSGGGAISSGFDTAASGAAGDASGGMGGMGDIFGGLADVFAKGPVAQNAATKSGPANLPLPQLPTPSAPVPIVDPRAADAQRQQLAAAMQRLNSGRLV